MHKCLYIFFFNNTSPASHFSSDGFGALHKDTIVSVDFQDLSQSLLGSGHSFFGPFAWGKKQKEAQGYLIRKETRLHL